MPRPEIGPEAVAWPYVAEAFRASGLEIPQTGIFSNAVSLQVAMLSTGRFLAMIPRSLTWFGGKQMGIRILPVKLPVRPPPVAIVTLKNRTISPVTRLFIDCAREVAKPLANAK